MGRLCMRAKFAVTSLVLAVPLTLTSASLVHQAFGDLQEVRRSQVGLKAFAEGVRARALAGDLAGLAEIEVVLGQAQNASSRTRRTDTLREELHALLKGIAAPPGVPREEFAGQRQALLDLLRETGDASLSAAHKSARRLHARMTVWVETLANHAGIERDADPRVRALAGFLGVENRALIDTIARAQSLGAATLARGVLNSEAGIALDELLVALEGTGERHLTALANLQRLHPPLREAVSSALPDPARQLAGVLDTLDETLLLAESLDTPWTDYHAALGERLVAYHEIDTLLLHGLGALLQARAVADRSGLVVLGAGLGFVLLLVAYLYLGFYVGLKRSVNATVATANRLAQGDFTARAEVTSRDELGDLAQCFNQTIDRVRALVESVSDTAGAVDKQAAEVERVATRSHASVLDQACDIQQAGEAMARMVERVQGVETTVARLGGAIEGVNADTGRSRELVVAARRQAGELSNGIEHAVVAINRLADNSSSISHILDAIKTIAGQINLLALNAAIEAARAGEQGRGFAVVAAEVRGLARRTQDATVESEEIVAQLLEGVANTVAAMHESKSLVGASVERTSHAGDALTSIDARVRQISDGKADIGEAVDSQGRLAGEIESRLGTIRNVSDTTAEDSAAAERSSREMARLTRELQSLVATFRL